MRTSMGHARKLWIEGPAGRLEAVLRVAAAARAAAVLAHPHPLHGGTLHNPVIFHTDRELNRAGLTTLRFNFRGTGSSEGEHDDGRGELHDLAVVATWLRGIAPSVPLLLVGYSFGSLCSIRHALSDTRIAGVVAIGLPVNSYEIEEIAELSQPLAVVQGSLDELGSPEEVRDLLSRRRKTADVRVVEGATHLFPALAQSAAREVAAAVESLLGAPTL
jgi:alpha/beta superfamily hydrolase